MRNEPLYLLHDGNSYVHRVYIYIYIYTCVFVYVHMHVTVSQTEGSCIEMRGEVESVGFRLDLKQVQVTGEACRGK